MPKNNYYFTSESVTEGHPDKLADQISDGILDAVIAQDPLGRVAAETNVATGLVVVTGEISTSAKVEVGEVVRKVIADVGYTKSEYGIEAENCAVFVALDQQSPDIAQGVNRAIEIRGGEKRDRWDETGAGDQGMVFGYATDETPEFLPAPIALAHQLARQLAVVRKNGRLPYLRPDGKTQVTVEYSGLEPVRVDAVVVSAQHAPEVELEQIKRDIEKVVIQEALPAKYLEHQFRLLVNPTGRFVIGGPHGDSGLTGRKIIVDTYGGFSRHGGGAFSGKDPTKVDRSAAYAARYVAKNIVAAGLARRLEIQIAYAIGVARPVSVFVDSFETSELSNFELSALIQKVFDLRPAAIIDYLNLRRPIYRQTAAYGHFGRNDLDLPWEKTDKMDLLLQYASKQARVI
jgi:S-adenosylmethionine synthetase